MVLMAKWNALFFDALSQVNFIAFQQSLQMFIGLVGISVLIVMYKQYLTQMLQIQWREWLATQYFNTWLTDYHYHYFATLFPAIDNPDQRLSNDIRDFSADSIDLFLGFIHSTITLISFISMLWVFGGNLDIEIAGYTIQIMGYMVWIALLYAILGSLFSHFIAKKLIPLNYQQQQYEADLRAELIQTKQATESIAISQAKSWHSQQLSQQFKKIVQNWWQIMVYNKRLEGFTSFYNRFSLVVPHLAAAPQFFAGKLTIGGLMQMASAFSYVQQALSWFIDAYAKLVIWRATALRLLEFNQALLKLNSTTSSLIKTTSDNHWTISHLIVKTPLETNLFCINHPISFLQGRTYHIKGKNGAGKSTFYKVLAGFWLYAEGTINRPQGLVLYFESQPYLASMSLKEYCTFNLSFDISETKIKQVLIQVGLNSMEITTKNERLKQYSKGELQRLIFAKVLLQRPKTVIFDESFNALNKITVQQLLMHIRKENPELIILFSSHFNLEQNTVNLTIENNLLK